MEENFEAAACAMLRASFTESGIGTCTWRANPYTASTTILAPVMAKHEARTLTEKG